MTTVTMVTIVTTVTMVTMVTMVIIVIMLTIVFDGINLVVTIFMVRLISQLINSSNTKYENRPFFLTKQAYKFIIILLFLCFLQNIYGPGSYPTLYLRGLTFSDSFLRSLGFVKSSLVTIVTKVPQ